MSPLCSFLVVVLAALLSSSPSLAVRGPAQALPRIHVFLTAGQSNAEGSNSDPILPEDAPNPRILALSCCNGSASLPPAQCFLNVSMDPLQPCIGAHGISFSRPFARSLLPTLPASDLVVIVQTAIGGTGFFDGTWMAYKGSGFMAAVAKLRRAWALLHAPPYERFNVTLDGVLWHQGEDDAGDNFRNYSASTDVYLRTDIIPLVEALRNTSFIEFSHATLPFVCGQLLPVWVNNASHPERAGVRDALALLPQYVPYSGHAPSEGLLGDPLYRSGASGSVIHFTGRSHRILGRRYYEAYLQALVNVPEEPPAPAPTTNVAVHSPHRARRRVVDRQV